MSIDLNNKAERIDLSIALLVILIAGIFILYYSFKTQEIFNPFGIELDNRDVESIRIEANEYVAEKINFNYKSKTAETATTQKENSHSQISAPKKEPISIDQSNHTLSSEISPVIGDEQSFSPNPTPTDSLQSTATPAEQKQNSSATILEKKELSILNKKESENSTPDTSISKECIILIGAFAKNKNKKRLLDILKKEGFKTFQTPFKNLERIGVYEDCNPDQLTKTVLDFRKRFAPDAVVLKRK